MFKRQGVLISGLLLVIASVGCGSPSIDAPLLPSSGNVIVEENRKAGDVTWQIESGAHDQEIQGYTSATSVNRGGTISLFVDTADPQYTIEIYRMGWYDGAGGRRMGGPVTVFGRKQPIPSPDPNTGLIECKWTDPYVVNVPDDPSDPTDWPSGVYVAKLTGQTSGKQAYIIFIVRDDARKSDLLFQVGVNTYEAYNRWGNESLYTHPPAFKVSFDRPYLESLGSGTFFRIDYNLLRFLEREGYDVTYATNVDTHENPSLLLPHKAFLSVAHDEYWTWQMRDTVEKARDSGVNLAFLGADASYWQVRYETDSMGNSDRTIVAYKRAALADDPMAKSPSTAYLTTTAFRDPPVNRPEDRMIGVMYNSECGYDQYEADMVVSDASHWVWQGTGVQDGTHLTGLLGYEVDRVFPTSPAGVSVIANSPCVSVTPSSTAVGQMTVYTAASGSSVVATGSVYWSRGLDDWSPNDDLGTPHPVRTNSAAQQATRNILRHFGAVGGTPSP